MALPNWVDFEAAEHSAAIMARNLSGPSQTWGSMFAHAQSVLAARTDNLHHELDGSYEFHEWQDLVAAARILDLAASEHGIDNSDNRRDAAVLSACAFGMSGTFVSATAVIRNRRLLNTDLSAGELVALSLSSPVLVQETLPILPTGSKHKSCIENVAFFLATGDEEFFKRATKLLQEITYEETNVWEGYLLRISRLTLAHVGQLATAKVLGPYKSKFPIGYLELLVKGSPLLLPSQYEAINKHDVFSHDENLLITLPTGTGKTLLGELALLSSLGQEPGLVCYVAPYISLARQVREKMRQNVPRNVQVHPSMGGYRDPVQFDPRNQPVILVATPERFDAMLRYRPELLSSIRCVVFDEAHMVGNNQRGLRLEGIITRLRLTSIRGGTVPRFVLLSAVLSNANELAKWIGVAPTNFIQGSWRPSAQRLLRWTQDGMLRLYAGDDPLRSDPQELLGETQISWPNEKFSQSPRPSNAKTQESKALNDVAQLADYMSKRYRQPILCICSTRKKTRQLATLIAREFEPLMQLPKTIKDTIDLIDQKHQFLYPLKESLRRGVAYHNSSLPHKIKENIERAVESQSLRVVAATTTLAEGVDLPFRATILVDWLVFDGDGIRPMESLLFKNIAGRCGRAGQFTEGDTIIFDNPVGDAEYTSPRVRPNLQDEIFFSKSQPTLTSAINKLNHQTSVATIGSQLLAAIAENPEVPNIASLFRLHSFAHQTYTKNSIVEPVDLAYNEIIDDTDGHPLAVTRSPTRLTSFGAAVSKGGLSPGTAKALRDTLDRIPRSESSLEDLARVGETLLKSLANSPEQQNQDLRRAVTAPSNRNVIRPDELSQILEAWLEGNQLQTIFAELPANKKSRRKIKLQTWLQGTSEENTWDEDFAKFCEFMNSCIEYFLPWVLRAAQHLTEYDRQQKAPWQKWALFVELGVGSTWGSLLLEERHVAERREAFSIGSQLDMLFPTNTPTSEQARILLDQFANT